MQCARAPGTEAGGLCAHVSCVGMHMVRACVAAGHTYPNSYTCVCAVEERVRECVGSIWTVCMCSPHAGLPLAGVQVPSPPRPLPRLPCVVGASGPRGRKADAGGCGQDGLDLFRLRWWERSGKLRASD